MKENTIENNLIQKIPLLTFIGYGVAYLFKYGYFTFYKVSTNFIQISISDIFLGIIFSFIFMQLIFIFHDMLMNTGINKKYEITLFIITMSIILLIYSGFKEWIMFFVLFSISMITLPQLKNGKVQKPIQSYYYNIFIELIKKNKEILVLIIIIFSTAFLSGRSMYTQEFFSEKYNIENTNSDYYRIIGTYNNNHILVNPLKLDGSFKLSPLDNTLIKDSYFRGKLNQ